MADEIEDVDLAAALGATAGVSPDAFTIFIPSKDRDDVEIEDQQRWVR